MAATGLALVAVATVALNVEYSRGVDPQELFELTTQVSSAITETSSRGVTMDELGPPCATEDRCIQDIAARTGNDWVVLMRVIGVSSRIRVVLNYAQATQPELHERRVDLTRDRKTWSPALVQALRDAIPPAPTPRPPDQPRLGSLPNAPPITAPSTPPEVSPWPYLAMGSGAAAAGIGVIFGIRSANARTAGEAQFLPDGEFQRLEGQAINSGITANIMFGAAAVGIVTGAVLLLMD